MSNSKEDIFRGVTGICFFVFHLIGDTSRWTFFCGKQNKITKKATETKQRESLQRKGGGGGRRGKGGDVGRGEILVRDERKQETRDMWRGDSDGKLKGDDASRDQSKQCAVSVWPPASMDKAAPADKHKATYQRLWHQCSAISFVEDIKRRMFYILPFPQMPNP